MQTIIKLRQIKETTDTRSGEMRLHLEFEFTEPATIEKMNITTYPADILNQIKSLIGKDVMASIEKRVMESENGRKFSFWSFTDRNPNFQLFKLQPISQVQPQSKPAGQNKAA